MTLLPKVVTEICLEDGDYNTFNNRDYNTFLQAFSEL